MLAEPVRGVARLVPDHREVGIPRGGLLQRHQPLTVAAQFDERGALEGERQRGFAELVGGLRRERERLLEAALAAEHLEVLAPGELQVRLPVDELEVRLLRLIERRVAEKVPRPGQGTLTGLGGEHAELGCGEHVANVSAGRNRARGGAIGAVRAGLAPRRVPCTFPLFCPPITVGPSEDVSPWTPDS